MTLNDKPADCIYAGIRKIISVSHWDEDGKLNHGDEITYSQFNVFNETDVKRLVDGDVVELEYVE